MDGGCLPIKALESSVSPGEPLSSSRSRLEQHWFPLAALSVVLVACGTWCRSRCRCPKRRGRVAALSRRQVRQRQARQPHTQFPQQQVLREHLLGEINQDDGGDMELRVDDVVSQIVSSDENSRESLARRLRKEVERIVLDSMAALAMPLVPVASVAALAVVALEEVDGRLPSGRPWTPHGVFWLWLSLSSAYMMAITPLNLTSGLADMGIPPWYTRCMITAVVTHLAMQYLQATAVSQICIIWRLQTPFIAVAYPLFFTVSAFVDALVRTHLWAPPQEPEHTEDGTEHENFDEEFRCNGMTCRRFKAISFTCFTLCIVFVGQFLLLMLPWLTAEKLQDPPMSLFGVAHHFPLKLLLSSVLPVALNYWLRLASAAAMSQCGIASGKFGNTQFCVAIGSQLSQFYGKLSAYTQGTTEEVIIAFVLQMVCDMCLRGVSYFARDAKVKILKGDLGTAEHAREVVQNLQISQFEADIHLQSNYAALLGAWFACLCTSHAWTLRNMMICLAVGCSLQFATDLGEVLALFALREPGFGLHITVRTWRLRVEHVAFAMTYTSVSIICLYTWYADSALQRHF